MTLHSQVLWSAAVRSDPEDAGRIGPLPLLLLWLPPGLEIRPQALSALAGYVRQHYGAGLSLRRRYGHGGGSRIELLGHWPCTANAVQAELARYWAQEWEQA